MELSECRGASDQDEVANDPPQRIGIGVGALSQTLDSVDSASYVVGEAESGRYPQCRRCYKIGQGE